ncbi:MAG: hypothetical protein DMD96_01020 [Candidatus Rokuibacteriota bacterium]|nr:MAG: hypothetical protein DMD96_01020 [Candidatus Rokubacteria bacterium]
MIRRRYKISAIGGSSVTLVPQVGTREEFGQTVTNIVITFSGTPDSRWFDVTNKEIEVHLETM